MCGLSESVLLGWVVCVGRGGEDGKVLQGGASCIAAVQLVCTLSYSLLYIHPPYILRLGRMWLV